MVKKLREIKETASDAAEILRALGGPEIVKSFKEIKEISNTIKEIVESLKDPAMVRNIENIRFAAEAAQTSASRIENSVLKVRETGILEEAKQTLQTIRETIDTIGNSQQSTELVGALKEMVLSIKDLIAEVNLLVERSSKSGLFRDVKEAVQESSKIYKNIRE